MEQLFRGHLRRSLPVLLAAAIAATSASCTGNEMGTVPNKFVNSTSETVEVVHVAPDGKETLFVPELRPGGFVNVGQTLETRSLCSSGQLVAREVPGGAVVAVRPLPLENSAYAPCGWFWEIADGQASPFPSSGG